MANKTERVAVQVYPEQKARWESMAQATGRTTSGFVIHCVESYLALLEKAKQKSIQNHQRIDEIGHKYA